MNASAEDCMYFLGVVQNNVIYIWLIPSVLIFRAVRTSANKVALNMTVPSLFRGMFMATSL